jgi:hypothetical protein
MSGRQPNEGGAWPWNEALADSRITQTLIRRGRNGVIGKWRNIWLAPNRAALIASITARAAAAAAASGGSTTTTAAATAGGGTVVGNGHTGVSGGSSRRGSASGGSGSRSSGSRSRGHASRSSSTGTQCLCI